jgi:hypothetical protein
MKWFRHDSSLIYDPTLGRLVAKLGLDGLAIYWGIVSYIAYHSEEFQVKIEGEEGGPKEKSAKLPQDPDKTRQDFEKSPDDFNETPTVCLKVLANTLFTTRRQILKTIEECAHLGLIDPAKWSGFRVVSCPMLEEDRDEYSKKKERHRERVRTFSGHAPEEIPLQAQLQEQKDLVVLSKSALNEKKLSTSGAQETLVPPVSDDDIKQFRRLLSDDIREWNQGREGVFDWIPSEIEVCRLLRGGDPEHKLRLCYQSMNLLEGDPTYPNVVRRAVGMMLQASRKKRITNPYGWLWTCLHGNAGGTTPWVQLATLQEES